MSNPVQDRIKKRIEELGTSTEAISKKAGLDRTYLRKYFERGSGYPRGDTLAKLETALELPAGSLMGIASSENEIALAPHIEPPSQNGPKVVPVMGTAYGSIVGTNGDGFEGFLVDNDPIDMKRMPAGLAGQRDIYAFYVTGDSMDPMHPPGELRFAQPHRAPMPGDTVVVQTQHWESDPGQAYIKIFKRRAGGMMVLEQINPNATIQIPLQFVNTVHRVVPNNELF